LVRDYWQFTCNHPTPALEIETVTWRSPRCLMPASIYIALQTWNWRPSTLSNNAWIERH